MTNDQPQPVNSSGDFNDLISLIRDENEVGFLDKINFIEKNKSEEISILFNAVENNDSLLTLAAGKHGLPRAVERMLNIGADINASVSTTEGSITAIERACSFGNWEVLRILLEWRKSPLDLSKTEPILCVLVKNWTETFSPKHNFQRCFELLLQNDDKNICIDVNQVDADGCSALHFAVKFDNAFVILELLKRGAYIGQTNKFNHPAIAQINPEVLGRHFNSCLSTNGFREGEDDFEVQFDYKCLVPPTAQKSNQSKGDAPNEMTAIKFIAESNDLQHLIVHPLMTSFLFLKWNRSSIFFYLNFILCSLYAVSAIAFILMSYYCVDACTEDSDMEKFTHILMGILFLLNIFVTIRELYQIRLCPKTYFRRMGNYMEWTMIVLIYILLVDHHYKEFLADSNSRSISSMAILLVGVEVFHLAGSLPIWHLYTHYAMLKTVISTFIQSIALYSVLILSFAFAFFIQLRNNAISFSTDESGENVEYSNLHMSIIKTLVMSNGEFDASSVDFKKNIWSYVMSIAFIFIISTILFNLLTGLAVKDIQIIELQSKQTYLIDRALVLYQYETFLQNRKWYR